MKQAKPTIDDVLKYARRQVKKHIFENAYRLPNEQKEEIGQDAMVRVIAIYDKIDPELGWKSLVYTHCFGAVIDYKKQGKGFGRAAVYREKLKELNKCRKQS